MEKSVPIGAALLAIAIILGWLGCDGSARFAQQAGDTLDNDQSQVTPDSESPPSETASHNSAGSATRTLDQKTAGFPDPLNGNRSAERPGTSPFANTSSTNSILQNDTIVIGTFNIETFGVAKMSHKGVVRILVDLVRQFDVLAIQELRSIDQTVIDEFVNLVNEDTRFDYGWVKGPRQGSGSYKEQYVYLYDQNTIELVDEGSLVPDEQNLLEREPLVSTFRCRGVPRSQAFSFTLMNVHTVPDESRREVNALAQMYEFVRQFYDDREDDVIILGDFNQPERNFTDLYANPYLISVVTSNVATNTAQNKSLDNIVFDRARTQEFTGTAGVLDFRKRYNLTKDQAMDVSDHFPVFAVFSTTERYAQVADGNRGVNR
ncbi:endonuclease/exonuclease/phosphatase family protein [Vicingaceae bacterium]|nr:endonuclease/exonuclease/phosphatase family protein [Vicingaceae bacterium]